ncbi:hypothetical protein DVH24_006707 [Malus domestica]|uniref:Histone deacetylase n=1 Tax=Malus domestica TaxID=3750 RepID=A0A498KAT4_MALDO|nr:hypothetical protein DVH24_006707 [Malus domestica]
MEKSAKKRKISVFKLWVLSDFTIVGSRFSSDFTICQKTQAFGVLQMLIYYSLRTLCLGATKYAKETVMRRILPMKVRVMIIDLDAHQGNSSETDFTNESKDYQARRYIDQKVEVGQFTCTLLMKDRKDSFNMEHRDVIRVLAGLLFI